MCSTICKAQSQEALGHHHTQGLSPKQKNKWREMKEREVPKRQCRVCTPVLLCVIMSGFFIAYTQGVGALCLPSTGCTTALAYYTTKEGDTLDIVGNYFQVSTQAIMNANSNITNVDTVFAVESIYIPFACKCINGQLGQNFAYKVQSYFHPPPPSGLVF